MTETTNDHQALSDVMGTDIDDVEAHGLREVAAAATIGAAVVGAGGMALASAHTPVPKTPAIVQQATDDSRELANDGTDAAAEFAGAVGSDAGRFAKQVGGSAHAIVDPQLQRVSNRVHTVATAATDLASDASRLTARTVRSAGSTATGVAGDTQELASTKVSATTKTALKVLSATRSAVGQGWDLSVSVFGANARTGGDMLDPTGRVTVTNAAGHVLTSAKIGDGVCKLHIDAIGEHETLTIHYAGDDTYSAIQLLWNPPVGF
jgi:hypothetical protein